MTSFQKVAERPPQLTQPLFARNVVATFTPGRAGRLADAAGRAATRSIRRWQRQRMTIVEPCSTASV